MKQKDSLTFYKQGRGTITLDLEFDPETSRMSMRATTSRKGADGKPISAGTSYNNIGKGDPISFIRSCNFGYFRDDIFGHATKEPDFKATMKHLREVAAVNSRFDQDSFLSADEKKKMREVLRGIKRQPDVSEAADTDRIIRDLKLSGIAFLQDDGHHEIRERYRQAVVDLEKHLWDPLQEELTAFVQTEEYQRMFSAQRTAVAPALEEAEDAPSPL